MVYHFGKKWKQTHHCLNDQSDDDDANVHDDVHVYEYLRHQ